MQLNVQYSLIQRIKTVTGLNTLWLYDGITLPTTKPFVTVEQMPNTSEQFAKGRVLRTYFHFQVCLYTNSASERAKLQDAVKNAIQFDPIPLYDAENTPANVVGYFYADVTGETPVSPEDPSDKTNYHKVYLDVEVDEIIHKE